jgi:hypothetical protein
LKQSALPKPTGLKKNESVPDNDDVEFQKAIEESLKASKQKGGFGMGDTMNSEDFKKAIELSKKFK